MNHIHVRKDGKSLLHAALAIIPPLSCTRGAVSSRVSPDGSHHVIHDNRSCSVCVQVQTGLDWGVKSTAFNLMWELTASAELLRVMCFGKKHHLTGRLLKPALPAISKWLSGIANVLPKREKQLFPGKNQRNKCYAVALCPKLAAVCLDPKSCTSHRHFWDRKEQRPTLI